MDNKLHGSTSVVELFED